MNSAITLTMIVLLACFLGIMMPEASATEKQVSQNIQPQESVMTVIEIHMF